MNELDKPAAAKTRRRVLERIGGRLDDPEALAQAAALLIEAGEGGAARLLDQVVLLHSGVSQDGAAWRAEAERRAGLTPASTPRAAGRTALDVALTDLRDLLGVDAAASHGAPPADHPGAGPPSQDRLAAAAYRLVSALREPASPAVFADIAAALDGLRAEALASSESAERDEGPGRDALRCYLLDIHDIAFAPFGSPALLHAFARTSALGMGALGARSADLVGDSRCALALLELALGRPLTQADEESLTRGVLLLTRRAPDWFRRDMVDEIADLGLSGPLRAMMDAVLRAPGHRRDREFLQRLRDAGLDLGELELGWQAQSVLAEGWSEDKNEWQALGDVTAYRGDYGGAERLFERALELDPGLEHARGCLDALRAGEFARFANAGGFGSSPERRRLRAGRRETPWSGASPFTEEARRLDHIRQGRRLAPELAPGPEPRRGWIPHDGLHFRSLGARRERTLWGELPSLRGIDVVRGFYVSRRPIEAVQVRLAGRSLASGAPTVHRLEGDYGRLKCVFNLWIDLCDVAPGRYELEVRLAYDDDEAHVHLEHVWVAAAASQDAAPGSDAVTDPPADPTASLEAAINSRPSAMRPARRALFTTPPERVLVLRADQLGDMICSIPALQRLRELLPDAELTGLVTPANAALARSLELFDDLIVVDFRTDPVERRRVMSVPDQLELEARLRARDFDLAIDLADNSPSRHLLRLSGARRLYGVQGRDYGFLDIEFQAYARDPFNGSENAPASAKMLAMVEWLGAAMTPLGRTIAREDLSASRLGAFGLEARGYVVLHTGARLSFSRWPHYPALARLLLEQTDLAVVLISDEPTSALRLGPGLIGHPRLRLIERALPFDDLDLLASWCAAFVGNDSGPKHLASLRGSQVVSLHCARNNWDEWGQENTGVILSRRVPCAGCQVRDYPDECGKAFVCMTAIQPQEVLDAVLGRVIEGVSPPALTRPPAE